MPLYKYEHDGQAGGECANPFEVLQGMNDAALEQCPTCGQACHRVISTFSAVRSARNVLSNQNLKRNGFTKYQRAGGGYYEKVCGKGPDVIKRG